MAIQPSDYIIGTIIFTLLTLGLVGVMTEVQSKNTNFVDTQQYSDFNKSFNHYSTITSSVTNLQDSITGSEVDNGIFGTVNGVLNSLMNTVWTTFRFLFSSFSFMNTAYLGLSTNLGLPYWLPIILGLIVIVVISFGIFSAVTRSNL